MDLADVLLDFTRARPQDHSALALWYEVERRCRQRLPAALYAFLDQVRRHRCSAADLPFATLCGQVVPLWQEWQERTGTAAGRDFELIEIGKRLAAAIEALSERVS